MKDKNCTCGYNLYCQHSDGKIRCYACGGHYLPVCRGEFTKKPLENCMKFVATYTTCAQIGENSWQDYKMSKVFDYTQSLSDVMTWLESLGVKDPNLSCVVLSDLVE